MSAGAYTGGANNGRLKINGGGKKKEQIRVNRDRVTADNWRSITVNKCQWVRPKYEKYY